MATVRRTPRSREDVVTILLHIRRARPRPARRVHAAINATLELLASLPNAGQNRDELAPRPRSLSVRRYRNYVIPYRPIADGIEVIRVLHGARHLPDLFHGM
jgi:toxin ParE1/3/4